MNVYLACLTLGYIMGTVLTAIGFLVDVRTAGREALRIETCVQCGKRWNVSAAQQPPPGGYICPHCASRARMPGNKKAPAQSETLDRRAPQKGAAAMLPPV